MSPAMAAGVTNQLWDVDDLVALWESYEQRRGGRSGVILTASVPTFLAQKSSLFRIMSSVNEPSKPIGEIIDHVERIR
jgi:hypothetical protein